MEKEIWKDVKGYEGLYQVSNLGNIRNIRRNKLLKPYKNGKDYLNVILYKNGKHKRKFMHVLVAEVFLNKKHFKYMPCENKLLIDFQKLQVNHKDEIKENNNVNNLEWCTNMYNCNYGSRQKNN